ncbi:hypothetical protein ColTof4_01300 [Colletotrichum tofieldiae]|nr:hypothetical protein ColTof3_08548 [Colletotrichum tofieldiae]GKT68877.1 hypothetical protein ColTof4_01300 [Colletotrichum tofieldiae]
MPYQDTRKGQDQDRLQPAVKVSPGTSGPTAGPRTGNPDPAEPKDDTTNTGPSISGRPTNPEPVPDEEGPEKA